MQPRPDEQFVKMVAAKVFKREPSKAQAVDATASKIYIAGSFEADLEYLVQDDQVVVAFSGSPFRTKLQRMMPPEEERPLPAAMVDPQKDQPFVHVSGPQGIGKTPALAALFGHPTHAHSVRAAS
eukprot:7390257-Prymnesium_polylepis.1